MKRVAFVLFLTIALWSAAYVAVVRPPVKTAWLNQLASVFFTESSKPEELKQTFAVADVHPAAKKLRILVVPGHDNDVWGTEYKGIKEADMTLALGKSLARLLSQDGAFDVVLARDTAGYYPPLAAYFSEHAEDIALFIQTKKQIMSNLVALGEVARAKTEEKIFHNKAAVPVATKLYGINKWANENSIDLVVHIHFNDYPRRRQSAAGEYSGFSIYVPEHQYSNARASKEIADAVSKRLQLYYPESNLPKEDAGVVEDQDLIAIGAFNTLDPASILVEYGYIYEPQFLAASIRSKVIADLATQTYVGIHDFFGGSFPNLVGRFNTALLPHTWIEHVAPGAQHNPSVLSLQAALVLEGVYPPKDFDPHTCPLAGTYGRCTKASLALFQQKYGLSDESGKLGPATLGKLNQLYGE